MKEVNQHTKIDLKSKACLKGWVTLEYCYLLEIYNIKGLQGYNQIKQLMLTVSKQLQSIKMFYVNKN